MVAGWTNPSTRTDGQGGLLANKDLRGIFISGNNGEVLSGLNLHDLWIHDVTGEICWIGVGPIGNPAPYNQYAGTKMNTGWDASKRTGGIFVEAQDGDSPTTFNNVTVENNVLERNSFGAFTIKQFIGGSGGKRWGYRAKSSYPYDDSNFKPHTNIIVRGNYIDQTGWYKGDGIMLTSVKDALVENNVVKNPGVCGIELLTSYNVTVQYNEVYGSSSKGGGVDTNAIDSDLRATDVIIQYNYVHDNGDGIMACSEFSTVIIRYNVLYNNKELWIRDGADSGYIQVLNNIFYNTLNQSTIKFTHTGKYNNESWEYKNNVFYNASANTSVSFTANSNVSYSNNLYYRVAPPVKDSAPVREDPLFSGVPAFSTGTSAATRFHDFSLLRPAPGSPMINQGLPYSKPDNKIDISPNGKDYEGAALSGAADIGIYASDFKGLAGIVADALFGGPAAGVTVTLDRTGEVVTGPDGKYTFAAVSPGPQTITVIADGYTGSETSLTVNADSVSWLPPLSTGEYAGSIVKEVTGTVTSGGSPLEGVKVTITKGAAEKTATTNSSGAYTLEDVSPGIGYTITASKDGYVTKSTPNFPVPLSGNPEAADFILVSSVNVYYNEDFDTLDDWEVKTDGHTVEIIPDPEDGENNLLHIYKPNSNSAAPGIYNKSHAGAYGIFTIETRLKRGSVPATGGQFQLYTYDAAKNFTPGNGTNSAADIAMETAIKTFFTTGSSEYTTIQSYTADTWYKITLGVNTGDKTFTFYVDGVVKGSGQLRTEVDKIDIFNICAGTTGATFGDFWVDYIKVYQGEPKEDTRATLTAGSAVNAAAADTSATVTFTGASGLTLGAGDFTVTGGGIISGASVSGDTASVTVTFAGNFGTAGGKTYTVGISPGSPKIKGDAAVTITQAGDSRKALTAGSPVSVLSTDTSATVTFTGASGLTLGAGDFTVTADGTISGASVNDNTASVTVTFAANTDTGNNKTYTVGINSGSTNIIGTAAVTITQYKQTTTNTVMGTVTARGGPLEGATVSINKEATTVTAPPSNSDGEYTLDVPFDSGYTITVIKSGYKTRTVNNIAVTPGPEQVIDFDLLNELTGTVIYDMDFDSLADGAFSDAGWQFTGNNGSAIEADPDNTGSKVLRLKRSGTFDFVNTAAANASDNNPFTIEIRAKRTSAGNNQWALYTNNNAALKSNSASVANIIMANGNIGTHANGSDSYIVTNAETLTAGTWYKIGIVVYPSTGVDTFDFYVDGVKKLEAKPVRNDNPVNYFHFYSDNAAGDLILDYFRVYAGEPQ
jgi:hypothetical protein